MRDLPSKGRCHAAFLLLYSARLRLCTDVADWLKAASGKPTLMAAALDLPGTAQLLLDTGLARADGSIVISSKLARFNKIADLTTLKGIARLLLAERPPDWLRTAVIDGKFVPEFVPQSVRDALSWLGDDLETIMASLHHSLYGPIEDGLLKSFGDAGELAVMSALQRIALNPRHVALVSDRFGYDIELAAGHLRTGLEIKTAVPSTSDRIFISRNEFDTSGRMGDRWRIVQVIFSSKVIASGLATAADVFQIRELTSQTLRAMAPEESSHFRWAESAEFRPSSTMWNASELVVAEDFTFNIATGSTKPPPM